MLRHRLTRIRLFRMLILLAGIAALLVVSSPARASDTISEDAVIERILDVTGGLITIIFTPTE